MYRTFNFWVFQEERSTSVFWSPGTKKEFVLKFLPKKVTSNLKNMYTILNYTGLGFFNTSGCIRVNSMFCDNNCVSYCWINVNHFPLFFFTIRLEIMHIALKDIELPFLYVGSVLDRAFHCSAMQIMWTDPLGLCPLPAFHCCSLKNAFAVRWKTHQKLPLCVF